MAGVPATRDEGLRCSGAAGDRKVRVLAPPVLRELDIEYVNAYPVDVLERVLGK